MEDNFVTIKGFKFDRLPVVSIQQHVLRLQGVDMSMFHRYTREIQ